MITRDQLPIPSHLEKHLNQVQLKTLITMMAFGWKLWFVRRPIFQNSISVVRHTKTQQVAVIDLDGEIITDHGVHLRGHLADDIPDTTEIETAFTLIDKKDH